MNAIEAQLFADPEFSSRLLLYQPEIYFIDATASNVEEFFYYDASAFVLHPFYSFVLRPLCSTDQVFNGNLSRSGKFISSRFNCNHVFNLIFAS